MPYVVGEVYGHPIGRVQEHPESYSQESGLDRAYQSSPLEMIATSAHGRLTANCRFMDDICDGGGNRDMMRLPSNDGTVGILFSNTVGQRTDGFLPCGVCTVLQTNQDKHWAICPRRLFAIGPDGIATPHQWLSKKVFRLLGFQSGDCVNVWSEIKLVDKSDSGATFNYRLDYVLRRESPRSAPMVIEVMTCSTSGGNRSKKMDMKSAFKNAVLCAKGLHTGQVGSPGVNLRQVWARMASQLIAKSEAAIAWGGKTVWIIQDALTDYIRTQTALPIDELHSPNWEAGEVNLIESDLSGSARLYSGPIRAEPASKACWIEILGTPHIPPVESLADKLSRIQPKAKVILD